MPINDTAAAPTDMQQASGELPRLLYVGDVQVASTVSGAALLFRLLQTYPTSKLLIVESDLGGLSPPEKRIRDVEYARLRVRGARGLCTRLAPWVRATLLMTAGQRAGQLNRSLNDFQPEAILSVAHGFSWLTACKVARAHDLPLHLVVHDDPVTTMMLPKAFRQAAGAAFSRAYRQAASRLCVSSYMAQDFGQRLGAPATVLYPSRAYAGREFLQPPERLLHQGGPLVIGYAGSVWHRAFAESLSQIAGILARNGGKLVIYAALEPADVRSLELDAKHVIVRRVKESQQLIAELRQEVDVLFVPMSFADEDRPNMECSFPSKLADYTAAGLPLLIWGPPYSSAVRWAREHPEIAEVVDRQDEDHLEESVRRLRDDPKRRMRLAATAIEIGQQYFSHEAATNVFFGCLRTATPSRAQSQCVPSLPSSS